MTVPRSVFLLGICCLLSTPLLGQRFDALWSVSKEERCVQARKIYEEEVSKLDVAAARQEVRTLKEMATAKSDRCLELQALEFLAETADRPEHKNEDSVLQLYRTALNHATRYNFKEEEAKLTYSVGMKYYNMKAYPQAFEHLLKSYERFQQTGFEEFDRMNLYLYNLGKVYFEFSDYDRALRYLNESLKFPFEDSRAEIHTYNTLGLTYGRLQKPDTALLYYNRGLDVAKTAKDSVWIGILSGNKAGILLKYGKIDEAKPLIMLDYTLSSRYAEWNSAANCLLLLADIHMDKEDSLATAEANIRKVEELFARTQGNNLKRDYFRTKARLCYLKGDYKNAYFLQDSFIVYKDRITAENDQNLLRTTEIKVQTEEYLSQIQLLESDRKQAQVLRNFLLAVAGFILIIAYLIINSQRLKRNKDRALHMLENQKAQEELKIAENALQGYMNSLLEKNRLIDKFRAEAEDLKKSASSGISPENEQILEKLYEATILTEEDWINFKRMFEKVHVDFFVRLKEKYPDLTVAETRLIVLTKLNLSITEIANMLGISPDSVRKTGSRLRKKLNLSSQTDIADIASDI